MVHLNTERTNSPQPQGTKRSKPIISLKNKADVPSAKKREELRAAKGLKLKESQITGSFLPEIYK